MRTRDAAALGRLLNRRRAGPEAAAGRLRRLGVDADDLMAPLDEPLERRHGKIRRAHEDEPQAHAGSRDALAALVNFLTTRSRFSREMRSMNSTPFEVVDLVLDAGGQQAFAVALAKLAIAVEIADAHRICGRVTISNTSGIDRQPSS